MDHYPPPSPPILHDEQVALCSFVHLQNFTASSSCEDGVVVFFKNCLSFPPSLSQFRSGVTATAVSLGTAKTKVRSSSSLVRSRGSGTSTPPHFTPDILYASWEYTEICLDLWLNKSILWLMYKEISCPVVSSVIMTTNPERFKCCGSLTDAFSLLLASISNVKLMFIPLPCRRCALRRVVRKRGLVITTPLELSIDRRRSTSVQCVAVLAGSRAPSPCAVNV